MDSPSCPNFVQKSSQKKSDLMLEARLQHATTLKKLLDAVKDLVTDVNLDCSASGIAFQSMDSSHVCLIALLLRENGFEHYRCDRTLNLGLSLANLGKIMRSVAQDDVLIMSAEDKGDTLNLMFESKSIIV
jgi:proliferating cell nuclear antigen